MCAVASCVWPKWAGSLRIGYVASLATKLSDTFASEIGKVWAGTVESQVFEEQLLRLPMSNLSNTYHMSRIVAVAQA